MKQKDISMVEIFRDQFDNDQLNGEKLNVHCLVISKVIEVTGSSQINIELREYNKNLVLYNKKFENQFTFLRFMNGLPLLIKTEIYNDLPKGIDKETI